MPAKGAEHAHLQRKRQLEILLQEISSHRSRARERENYHLAMRRNNLEEQRQNLRYGLNKLPESLQAYYGAKIRDLSTQINESKKKAIPKVPRLSRSRLKWLIK